MIKTAHVGVGISGHEGRQAVLASDYSMAQFRFLQRLLFVHGRQGYFRVAGFIHLFFYKAFSFALSQMWFAIYCGWSATSLYDQWFIMNYNMMFTSTPVLYYAICEQDVSDRYSMKYPKLYQAGLTNDSFNWRTFLVAEFEGIVTSVVSFFIMRYGYGDMVTHEGYDLTTSRAAMGIAVGTCTVIAVTARSAIETSHWTFLNVTPIISIGFCFLLQYLFSIILAKMNMEFENLGVVAAVWYSPNFWLCTIASLVICCLPVYAVRLVYFIFKPSLRSRIQMLAMCEDEQSSWHFRLFVVSSAKQKRHNNNGVLQTNGETPPSTIAA